MCTVIFRVTVFILYGVAGGFSQACPHELNPLELNPPQVVVRYGDPVSVNCNTSSTDHEGMGWEATAGGTGFVEDVGLVTWTVENLTDWNAEPKCFVTLSDGHTQCLKTLLFTLYKHPDSVSISSLSHTGPMVEGTEYQLSCHVLNFAPVQNLTVTWYKGNETITTYSIDDPIKTPDTKSYNLTIIPSRHDDGAQYRCEAEMDLGTKESYFKRQDQLVLKVHYGPHINCNITSSPFIEGESLEDHCSVEGNPSPTIRWLKDDQSIDPSTPLTRGDSGLYTIEAKGDSTVNKSVNVRVHYGPEITGLHCPQMLTVAEHSTITIACTAEGYPEPDIMWMKNEELVYLPKNPSRGDAGQYVFVANNSISTVNHTLDIDVQYPPSEILELEDTEGDIGSTIGLKCSTTGNPEPSYHWSYYNTSNVAVENEDRVSLINIHNAGGINIGSYTCYAQNELGNISKTARVTIRGAKAECPISISSPRVVVEYGNSVSVTCNATHQSSVESIYWSPNSLGQSTTLRTDSKNWNSRPDCIGTFTGIGKCRKSLDITLYKRPDSVSISLLNHTGPMLEGTEYQLSCDVRNVAPVQNLTVTWYKGNETIMTNSSDGQFKTPVNESSVLTITPSRHDDGAQYRCEAQLDMGSDGPQPPPAMTSEPHNVTVHYKPHINATKLPARIPVLRGYPEDLVCEADGNPKPMIQWQYFKPPGKQIVVAGGNLTVSEALFYNCTATNVVGTSTMKVEVVLKEDYLPLIAGFVAIAVGVISAIFVFIFCIYYKNTRMGHYSLKDAKLKPNTPNGNVAQNGRDMPLPMMKVC